MIGLEDAVVFVSGGSRGIGRACAELFAAAGARVVVGYARNEAAAREVVLATSGARHPVESLRLDVADADACSQAIEGIVARQGRLDVLVNNAGIAIDGLLARVKEDEVRQSLAVNLEGAIWLARAACRPMMRQRKGAIVNVSSVVGERGNPGQSIYAASKAALLGFTKSLAQELSSRNIRVNAVTPGFIETDMTAGIPETSRTSLISAIPLGRLGRVEEVARSIAFLASDSASYITGEVLRVNGGMLM